MTVLSRFLTLLTHPKADLSDLEKPSWLIVGLGNPGPQYVTTRHNVGYMCTDLLASSKFQPVRGFQTVAAPLPRSDGAALVVRTTTYMNLSGKGVAPLAKKLDIAAEKVIVIHDELDLPPGTVRVKKGGNENGHNGLKSMSAELGTRDYLRIRIGIGRPRTGESIPEYVLQPVDFTDDALDRAATAATLIVTKGLAAAQNEINKKV